MGLTAELARGAGLDVRKVGSLRLISSTDTLAFLDACLAAGVRVLGVEGFRLEGGEARPDMSAIADFSDLMDSRRSVLEAKRFVETVATSDLTFDFVLTREGVPN